MSCMLQANTSYMLLQGSKVMQKRSTVSVLLQQLLS
jgi:hypothetical protein